MLDIKLILGISKYRHGFVRNWQQIGVPQWTNDSSC
jgi:hypothetical protein